MSVLFGFDNLLITRARGRGDNSDRALIWTDTALIYCERLVQIPSTNLAVQWPDQSTPVSLLCQHWCSSPSTSSPEQQAIQSNHKMKTPIRKPKYHFTTVLDVLSTNQFHCLITPSTSRQQAQHNFRQPKNCCLMVGSNPVVTSQSTLPDINKAPLI